MLDTDTKRRIDTARDILVGKVPDPKSQVEQITIALIYKFMDDMDAESEEFGGKRKFFVGEFARYGWAKLMRSGLGGHETLNLYAEGIAKMPENPGIPLLFRDIFKNAYLPYRDPETLRAFLKIIDEFTYDHSERLGDAFEYLLSVLGSQGDAGQFRTPRHIIDFMVGITDPKKTETVLDPACGTAGFLISSYKHILMVNTDAKGNSTLTPDEKGRLAQNFKGYDISPDMVRLSLVNLYLHGFADPHIAEYDTLTSQDRWNEYADVILANPPFMSPKGGIKPHNRFSVQSKRSEVLFVDYMAEHLTPAGRAGIIVPEGIIFQSQTAYTQLRKMLVEEYLVAVVSLPAGEFNPYSGVKTSILIFDKSLAKRTGTIAFFKIENDGFGLGAQRREIGKNDLPQAYAEIGEYIRRLRSEESVADFQPTLGLIVPKEKIAANGDYNLSGERYREGTSRTSTWPLVPLGSVVTAKGGNNKVIKGTLATENNGSLFPAYSATGQDVFSPEYDYDGDGIVISAVGARCGKCFLATGRWQAIANTHVLIPHADKILPKYLFLFVNNEDFWVRGGAAQPFVKVSSSLELQIPLPPLEVQKEIVAEIEGYQKVINGAHAVIDNYRPHIPIHPDWPTPRFVDAPFEIIDGDRGVNYPKKEDFSPSGYCVFLNTKNVRSDGFNFSELEFVSKEKDEALRKGKLQRGDVVLTTRGTIGNTGFFDESVKFDHIRLNSGMLIFRPDTTKLSGSYLFHFFQSQNFQAQRDAIVSGAAQPQLPIRSLNEAKIPLPPLATQQAIAAEIEAEQALVAANRELIARFEKKIQATLSRVWGEETSRGETQ
ncbi:MAG: N-6 DNA methylase [Proteobacteria bacterium]|nr:N-6 DNA methylase [Pseudomonadota bacterium]MBU2260566.1 N-6 DNA methylase [Pseudomonadota bacterium]